MTEYSASRYPTLRKNSKKYEAVKKLQSYLVKAFDDLQDGFVDGLFGPNTEKQVKRFQKLKGLTQDGIVGENTWRALLSSKDAEAEKTTRAPASSGEAPRPASPTSGRPNAAAEKFKRAFQTKGYAFLDDGEPYYLNIVGVRSASTEIDSFDDEIYLIYRDESTNLLVEAFPATTDPGKHYTQVRLANSDVDAILVPGQYRDVYKIDTHGGKYTALCQRGGKVRVWRDGNMDDRLDRGGRIHEGWFGINIHRSSATESSRVGRYSAGCQVFKRGADFAHMMALAEKSKQTRGNKFTYTLLERDDIR